ncbi:MAG TPA: hypothetical protein VF101_08020 [Gaiellaceae bacterium]
MEGDGHPEAVLTRLAAAGLLLVLAGCGGGAKGLAASCDRQRAALDKVTPVRNLTDAQEAIREVIAIERAAVDDLRAAKADPRIVAAYERAVADARRLQLSLGTADPTQTMSALRMGPSAGRRTVERARLLVQRACD